MDVLALSLLVLLQVAPEEAPAAFDGLTNGFTTQEQFLLDQAVFSATPETLGVAHNHINCVSCHFNPLVGGGAPGITELGVGRFANGIFSGFRIVRLASSDADIQERIDPAENVRTLRTPQALFGDGFIECISNSALQANTARSLVAGVRGELTVVPLLESPEVVRFGRFGWKSQLASLLSFTGTASAVELGDLKPLDDPKIVAMTNFQRSLKAPPRDLKLVNDPDVIAGDAIFRRIGCTICHTPTWTTAAPGTVINGGTFTVPESLGSKIIHPFSDFALWNIGTGDGVVHEGAPQTTRNKMRTQPLWGLRTRALLFHDGRSITRNESILLHRNQAQPVTSAYRVLPQSQQAQLLAFLNSL